MRSVHAGKAFAAALLAAAMLSGCATQVPTDDAGTVKKDSPQEAQTENPNYVDTAQLPDSSFIYDASIADLTKADPFMNGQTVQVAGEVVGDRIKADLDAEHCWITLQATDGSYAEIAVYMPDGMADEIDTYGAYAKRGTTLRVRGVFNLACADHEGLTDLHAAYSTVVKKGEVVESAFDAGRFTAGAVLVLVGIALMLFFRFLRNRRL